MKFLSIFTLILAMFFFGCNLDEKLKPDEQNDLTMEDESPDEPPIYEDGSLDTDLDSSLAEDTATTNIADEQKLMEENQNTKTDDNQKRYYIIGGSFHEFQNAEKLYGELKGKGYSETQILDPVNRFNRVVINSFTDEATARKELKRLRQIKNDETIWLLEGK